MLRGFTQAAFWVHTGACGDGCMRIVKMRESETLISLISFFFFIGIAGMKKMCIFAKSKQ